MSTAQLDHRQRFREALAWRKGLSKQERNFLESYCLGKHLYGGDRLTARWYKFALRIYLEKVTFELVRLPGDDKPGTLHVKHPALLAITHRRGVFIVEQRNNLSSLKDETLVEQVGLDVQPGDKIYVVTIAGQLASYTV